MPTYHQICYDIWQLHERYPALRDNETPRHFLFPPPWRGRSADLLFVGGSPDQDAQIGWNGDYDHAIALASEFEFIPGGPRNQPHLQHDPHYGSLLKLARLVDDRFSVWWQASDIPRSLLVEFTDAVPLATAPQEGDLEELASYEAVQTACRQILTEQLEYYRPRVVVAHGEVPCRMLHRVITGHYSDERLTGKTLYHQELRCVVHFTRFIRFPAMSALELTDLILAIRGCANLAGVLA